MGDTGSLRSPSSACMACCLDNVGETRDLNAGPDTDKVSASVCLGSEGLSELCDRSDRLPFGWEDSDVQVRADQEEDKDDAGLFPADCLDKLEDPGLIADSDTAWRGKVGEGIDLIEATPRAKEGEAGISFSDIIFLAMVGDGGVCLAGDSDLLERVGDGGVCFVDDDLLVRVGDGGVCFIDGDLFDSLGEGGVCFVDDLLARVGDGGVGGFDDVVLGIDVVCREKIGDGGVGIVTGAVVRLIKTGGEGGVFSCGLEKVDEGGGGLFVGGDKG